MLALFETLAQPPSPGFLALQMKAERARLELGDEEINRRVKAMQEEWQREQAKLNEYRLECKAARQRHEPAPPHPAHNPEGWRQWRYTRDFERASHR